MASKFDIPPSGEKHASYTSEDYDLPPPVYRRKSESSTERSLYDEKDQAVWTTAAHPKGGLSFSNSISPNTSPTVREYGFYHPKVLSRGIIITDVANSTETAKKALYYVEVSEFKLKKPDVTLHAVPSTTPASDELEQAAVTGESGPVLGVAQLPKLSRHYKVALGDPATQPDLSWVEMRNPNMITHGEYRMNISGRTYMWKRTHDAEAGVEGSSAVRIMTHNSFQLTDMASGEVLAVYLENKFKSWKKKGKLRIFRDFGSVDGYDAPEEAKELKLLIFLSIAAILEKARRRSNARNSNGGGGGGGSGG